MAEACDSYLPAAAKAALLKAAARQPAYSAPPVAEGAEEMREEIKRSPMEAEAHIATEL